MPDYVIVVATVAVTIALFSAIQGGHPERWASAIIVGGIVLDLIIQATIGHRSFEHFDISRLSIDLVQFTALLIIALRANRNYPLGLAAAQLLAIVGNLAALFHRDGWNEAYWAMTQMPILLQLSILAGGLWAHRRRVSRIGNYNSWSPRMAGGRGFS